MTIIWSSLYDQHTVKNILNNVSYKYSVEPWCARISLWRDGQRFKLICVTFFFYSKVAKAISWSLQNKSQAWCTLLFLTLKRSMYTLSSRESPFAPFQPGCPWEMKAKRQSDGSLTGNHTLFYKSIQVWSCTYRKTRWAIIAGLPRWPWFSMCPVTAVCTWLAPGPSLSWVALQSERHITTVRSHHKQNKYNLQRASTVFNHTDGWTYRNAVVSRKPRNAGHSLWSDENHTLNNRTNKTVVILTSRQKNRRIFYHISFKTHDATMAMVPFLPLMSLDAWITLSP